MTAPHPEGIGVINDDYNPDESYLVPNRNKTPKNLPFPYGDLPQKDTVFIAVDYFNLGKIVDDYFKQSTDRDMTRSLLVVYKNKIIAEKYADGFDKDSKILGWSIGKSIVSTVIGVLDQQAKIDINDVAPIDDWQHDERSRITINNLLQMNSGLAWVEDYTKISDITKMLYLDTDMTQSQVNKPLIGKPNESWKYSSGTSNLLSGIVRKQFKTHQKYLDFWYSDLIDKMGMYSMLLEADLAGNYVASSYVWASTRDWAKYGLLYLNNGNWNGEQIISEDWVRYTSTPTNTSEGMYGAQFWLNTQGHLPDVPKDMFMADGFQGQRIFIIPSKDLVVVRTGITDSQKNKKIEERKDLISNENKDVIEYELGNRKYNNLLKNILTTIK
jgi:CubicO group peptidase (beta-lactamase class C family)